MTGDAGIVRKKVPLCFASRHADGRELVQRQILANDDGTSADTLDEIEDLTDCRAWLHPVSYSPKSSD